MINRVLIRIKVIQILYSFLLMEKHFALESAPESPTKEKRFAYSLYLDMLVLMIDIADSIIKRGGERPLADTRFITRVRHEEAVRSLLAKYKTENFPYMGIVNSLAEKIKESGLYKNYIKDVRDDKKHPDMTLWTDIYNIFIYPDTHLNSVISHMPGYTVKGVEKAREMVLTTLANFMSSQENTSDAEKMLQESLDKARELYFRLLWLPVELTDIEEKRLDERRYRHLVSEADLNPNLKFVENALVNALRNNEQVKKYIESHNISWESEESVMMDNLLKNILGSEIYANYMASKEHGLKEDVEFWRETLKKVVFTNEHFLEVLEDQSVFWNDDLDIIGTFALKTLRKFEDDGGDNAIFDQFKDKEDAEFGKELVRFVLQNREEYRDMINNTIDSSQWETERLAFMDVVVMQTALAEILNFPKIPLTVSLNEYIEIAKCYSTNKSGSFVNGILARIVKQLQKEGKIL